MDSRVRQRTSSFQPTPISLDIECADVESIYSNLIYRATGGVRVRSTSAPALSTQFVKSKKKSVAQPGAPGAFAEIVYPSSNEVEKRMTDFHDDEDFHLYTHTKAAAAFHAGYGERSARALAKEESTYQLKGVFQSASLAYSKLRARIDARDGSIQSIDTIFANFWGLDRESVESVPRLYIAGSEAQRLSAMEDRAYHSLSAHPAIAGGFRVNTATLAPDALGIDIPLNWPRLRTALKAIAMFQISGDPSMAEAIRYMTQMRSFAFRMEITEGSQPVYTRPKTWERIVEKLSIKEYSEDDAAMEMQLESDFGYSLRASLADTESQMILGDSKNQIAKGIRAISRFVQEESAKALNRTIDVMLEYRKARAELNELDDDGFGEIEHSALVQSFEVPKYKVRRSTLYRGTSKEKLGKESLPDVDHHGKARTVLDMEEIRSSGLSLNLDIAGALNMAVYMTVRNESVRPHAYRFLIHLSNLVPKDDSTRPVAERLRDWSLFEDARTREYGPLLFGGIFMQTLDVLLKNLVSHEYKSDLSIKREMWDYLSSRTPKRRPCPVPGDWRDLIPYLHTAPEGWSLFYWVRISIGKLHHQACSNILAPVSAGVAMDALTMVRRGIKERTTMWAERYTARYREIEAEIKTLREQLEEVKAKREAKSQLQEERSKKYIPPAARTLSDLDHLYLLNQEEERIKGFTSTQYEKMVECQSKAKFFSAMEVYSIDRRVLVGVGDERMVQMYIEFYQARWASLEKRAKRAKKNETYFQLGRHRFTDHPWGELITEFPSDIRELLDLFESLDPRAWTVSPEWLYEKLRKSITELWADVRHEIRMLETYVREVHEGTLSEQEEAMALSKAERITNATYKVDAISIPVPGYRQPSQMPNRNIIFGTTHDEGSSSKSATVSVQTSQTAFTTDKATEPPDDLPADLDDELDDDDDGCFDEMAIPEDDAVLTEIAVDRCLSINQIWEILGLPETSDDLKKFYINAPKDYDVNGQHLESGYGPVIIMGEEHQVHKKWSSYARAIERRMKRGPPAPLEDDM